MIETSKLGQLAGSTVKGSDGDTIGKIVDVYESTDGGGGTFATVSTGLVGGGSSFFPLDAADLQGSDVVVPYTKEFVKDAPKVINDDELTAPEEERLFQYYSLGGAQQTQTQTQTETVQSAAAPVADAAPRTAGEQDAITLSEERLRVGTQREETGRARLRKYVVTETETRTVPVMHEEVRIERETITDGAAVGADAFSEQEIEVKLAAERAVIDKEAVAVEKIRVAKEQVVEQQTVTEQVRKERVDIDAEGSTIIVDEDLKKA